VIDAAYRAESRRVLATLIRLLGGFELAEEAGGEQALVEHEFDRGRPPAFPRHYEPRLQEPERHTDSWVKSGYLVDTSDESTKISVTVKS